MLIKNFKFPVYLPVMALVFNIGCSQRPAVSKEAFKRRLEIRFERDHKDSGDIKGINKGDTLLGDFHFNIMGCLHGKEIPLSSFEKETN